MTSVFTVAWLALKTWWGKTFTFTSLHLCFDSDLTLQHFFGFICFAYYCQCHGVGLIAFDRVQGRKIYIQETRHSLTNAANNIVFDAADF